MPIIHGDLSCDTIFIQHNGLIKIGSIAPDIVHTHVKTCLDNSWSRNMHYLAPELHEMSLPVQGQPQPTAQLSTNTANNLTSISEHVPMTSTPSTGTPVMTTAIDIYAFGMVALEVCLSNIEASFEQI